MERELSNGQMAVVLKVTTKATSGMATVLSYGLMAMKLEAHGQTDLQMVSLSQRNQTETRESSYGRMAADSKT
jgi:hypothetical protein